MAKQSLPKTNSSIKECSVRSCSARPVGRGYCKAHYLRWWRYGDPRAEVPVGSLLQQRRPRGKAHPNFTHGATANHQNTPEYDAWASMKRRCTNPRQRAYKWYGAQGIQVCERWLHSFANFLADMGPRPTPTHSIDRIDSTGNYEPINCRWATKREQSTNRCNNRLLTYNGITQTLTEWGEQTGLSYSIIARRLKRGWPPSDALTRPVGYRFTPSSRKGKQNYKVTEIPEGR